MKYKKIIENIDDDRSSFDKQWANQHGLMLCECDELVEYIRGLK